MGNLGYFTPKDGVMGLLASGDVIDVSLVVQTNTDPQVWYGGLGKSCKQIIKTIALCNLFPRKMDGSRP